MGFLDRLRPKGTETPPSGADARSTREVPPPPPQRALSDDEAAGLQSLMDRASKSADLTGAFEISERGGVWMETTDGGSMLTGGTLAEEAAALVRGKHFTEWADRIHDLERDGDVDGALALALECVDATEREARLSGLSPAPGYTEMAAIIYRQRHDYDAEIALIERYLTARRAAASANPGALNAKLSERLEKAKALRAKRP